MSMWRNAKRNFLGSICYLVGGAGVALLGAASAQAAEQQADASASSFGDIVVTATKRSESIQKIPSAIVALPETFLKEAGAQQVADIVKAVPGFSFTQNSTGTVVLAIRGIQSGATYSASQSPVAVYYDEVSLLDPYSSAQLSQLNMFDISRVEVLKGPQGTLFGAGALSGVLRVITNKPNFSKVEAATELTAETTKGGEAGYQTNFMINLPIVNDSLAIRAVGSYASLGGWIDNTFTGRKDVNRVKAYGGRVAIGWKPVDNLDLVASVMHESSKPRELNYEPDGGVKYTSANEVRQFNNSNMTLYSLTANLEMPWATLTSSSSYLRRRAKLQRDFTGIARRVTRLPAPGSLVNQTRSRNYNQEIRLASNGDGPFKWLVGAFFEDYRIRLPELISQPGVKGLGYSTDFLEAAIFGAKISDQAAFGEVSYEAVPGLTFTAGARYGHYKVGTDSSTAIFGPTLFEGAPKTFARTAKYNKATPKFSVSYNATPDIMLYGLAAQGYRSGHANLVLDTDPVSGQALPVLYKPDQLWNYEIGIKSAFFDRNLIFNASLYYIDWSDIQLQQQSASYFYVDNSGDARSKGVEVQVTARPVPPLEIGGSLSYTDAKLRSVIAGTQATPGDRLPGSAKWNVFLYGQYTHELSDNSSLAFRMNYSYVSKSYSNLQNFGNPAALTYGKYGNVDAQTTLTFGPYEAQFYVRNLTNSSKRIAAFLVFPPTLEVLQRPRTMGLTFRAHI